jgi:hypothetical protein
MGSNLQQRRQHEVLDADWSVSPVKKQNKDRAWARLRLPEQRPRKAQPTEVRDVFD